MINLALKEIKASHYSEFDLEDGIDEVVVVVEEKGGEEEGRGKSRNR